MGKIRWLLCLALIVTTITTSVLGSDLGEGSVEDLDDHTELDSRSGGHHVKILPEANVVLSHDKPRLPKPKVRHTTCVTRGDSKQAALMGSWCQRDLRESGMKQKQAANCPLKIRAVDTDPVKCPELKPKCEENKIRKKCPFTCFKCDPSKLGFIKADEPVHLAGVSMDLGHANCADRYTVSTMTGNKNNNHHGTSVRISVCGKCAPNFLLHPAYATNGKVFGICKPINKHDLYRKAVKACPNGGRKCMLLEAECYEFVGGDGSMKKENGKIRLTARDRPKLGVAVAYTCARVFETRVWDKALETCEGGGPSKSGIKNREARKKAQDKRVKAKRRSKKAKDLLGKEFEKVLAEKTQKKSRRDSRSSTRGASSGSTRGASSSSTRGASSSSTRGASSSSTRGASSRPSGRGVSRMLMQEAGGRKCNFFGVMYRIVQNVVVECHSKGLSPTRKTCDDMRKKLAPSCKRIWLVRKCDKGNRWIRKRCRNKKTQCKKYVVDKKCGKPLMTCTNSKHVHSCFSKKLKLDQGISEEKVKETEERLNKEDSKYSKQRKTEYAQWNKPEAMRNVNAYAKSTGWAKCGYFDKLRITSMT